MKKYILALLVTLVFLLTACNGEPAETTVDTTATLNPGECVHTDDDSNDYCDGCGEYLIITVDFYAINDLHGKFDDTDSQPGVDELTTYLKNAEKTDDYTVFLSSGDMWQGSSESNLTRGLLITDWMNELDFVSMTLGNHEYDWGEEYIKNNAEIAEFPLLAINIYDRATDERVDYCEPSVLIEEGDITIGIIGAIGNCYSSIAGDKVEDVYFKTGRELTELVKAESDRLRAMGADFIVYSLHGGHGNSITYANASVFDSQISSYYDISLSDGYVDLAFEGHTHQRYVFTDSKGVYHLQNGGDNRGISHVEVNINRVNNNWNVNEAEFVPTSAYSHLEDDPIVDELLEKYEDEIAIATRNLGKNDRQKDGNELRQLIAELYLETGMERWGEEYDIVLGGGFLSVRSPGYLGIGDVFYSDLQMLFPFDNQLVLCSVKGEDLRRNFLETDNGNYFISLSESAQNIYETLDPNGTYYIVVDSYSSTYGPNRLTEIERYDDGIYARDLLAAYIENGGMASPETPFVLTSIPEIYQIGNALGDNEETWEMYYVRGRVKNIASPQYGNMTIEDEEGNTLYLYGLYDANGVRYDAMENPPVVGDEITVKAPIKKYISPTGVLVELSGARLYEE